MEHRLYNLVTDLGFIAADLLDVRLVAGTLVDTTATPVG
jgi:hypothetical protein